MCYILIMHKDVIYIEPEDDITDIITKLEKTKEKIVAIVPPQKSGVLRSIVNIKLIAKTALANQKTVVLVTTESNIIRLAAIVKIPVTKDLQSAPAIPPVETNTPTTIKTELLDNSKIQTTSTSETSSELTPSAQSIESPSPTNDTIKNKEKTNSQSKKTTNPTNPILVWIKKYQKWLIFGSIGIILLILVMIWAFIIAPAVTISIDVHATSSNFSENITFTNKLESENNSTGQFFLEEKTLENPVKLEFTATGSKNIGEKAQGTLIIYAYFKDPGSIKIKSGTIFTYKGLTFSASENTDLIAYSSTPCENQGFDLLKKGCLISKQIKVVASAPGSKFNLPADKNNWFTSIAQLNVYSKSAMSGGTDHLITTVQQSDIDNLKNSLTSTNETENKAKLRKSIKNDHLLIESSLIQTLSEIKSTPAVNEEVKEGIAPTISATTITKAYVIDQVKVKEFISEKAKLNDNQKIYSIENPFIENFLKTDQGYVGKLKTTYLIGPNISEQVILERIKGLRIGNIKPLISDMGASSVTIERSFPWVNSVPNDPNKITIKLNIKE